MKSQWDTVLDTKAKLMSLCKGDKGKHLTGMGEGHGYTGVTESWQNTPNKQGKKSEKGQDMNMEFVLNLTEIGQI